jgi:xylulokinase
MLFECFNAKNDVKCSIRLRKDRPVACYLGIDVGTSGTKALLMNSAAKVLATATAAHEISSPRPGWSQQDGDNWWSAAVRAVRAVVAKAGIGGRDVSAIGLSGQMHGLVITDGAGRPLRPAIIWNDQRSAPQAQEIERAVGGRRKLIALAGNVAMTSFTLTKLLWVRRHERRMYDRIRHLLLPKDYIRLRLTGEYVGDVSDMSGTLMLDPRKRDWSSKIISIFHLDRSILPPVVESHEVAGRLRPAAAAELGLVAGTPVVGGAGDQPAGAVGNGVVRDGLTSATMGTSGVVYVHSRRYATDPAGRVQTFCSAVAGEYCMFGCILAAGGSLQWYRNVLGAAEVRQARRKGVDPYELLTAQAAKAPLGCEGLFFLPYLTGERTPHADPFARGCWIGLHSRTSRRELVRSVMEGATYAMNDAVTILKDRGLKIRQIRLSGGGARSAFWRQLQADVYGTPCVTINTEEGPAYGAALLAAVGAGTFRDVAQACQAGIRITRTICPRPKAAKRYAELYAQYRRLYPALKDEFRRIAGGV